MFDCLFLPIRTKFSCPSCNMITKTNICGRCCNPWGTILCSNCDDKIKGSIWRGLLQVCVSAITFYLCVGAKMSPREVASFGFGAYFFSGLPVIFIWGVGNQNE